MNDIQKIHCKIGNKQGDLNKLYNKRTDLEREIARIEGEIEGLRDAQSIIDKSASEKP